MRKRFWAALRAVKRSVLQLLSRRKSEPAPLFVRVVGDPRVPMDEAWIVGPNGKLIGKFVGLRFEPRIDE